MTCSIGITIFPEDGGNATELLKNADMAMYNAKSKGRNTYTFYDHSIGKTQLMKHDMETNLRYAIVRNEFELYYQPQVDLITG